ncbi:uncharacterized protein LOC127801749 isoform X2 [Diospyros lotus]|uniref:uncharacterized protein LOC127801749 isoform X2 n=1 Tax=Diospyros lotus TaxID=55363 RepID=UPI0022581FFB|nr:uncharacterized protein LOC127801749 isoform X2 [Diospyros lotus]
MADSEQERRQNSTKRKLRSTEEGPGGRPSKATRKEKRKTKEATVEQREPIEKLEESAENLEQPLGKLEDGPPWRNLQLVLSLQNKSIDLQRKVELAADYVKLRVSEVGDDHTESLEAVSISRVMVFLNNWVQSLLISSEKKIRAEGYKFQSEIIGSCLDYRCWEIFKYCLEESMKLHVSLSFSRDFLRVIHCIARDALSRLNVEAVSNVLELVQKIIDHDLDGCKMGLLVLELSYGVLEPFVKFLRIHPIRKNGFRDFVDKLLESLLHLLSVSHLRVNGSGPGLIQNLMKLIKEIFSHGLFHPLHMDGFMNLQSTGNYKVFEDGKPVDSEVIIKSYHRHLFDKLEKVLAGKNILAFSGVGEMFHLFINCVKNQKGASVRGGLRFLENNAVGYMSKDYSENDNVVLEKHNSASILNADARKSLLDFFVQIMEPLLQEFDIYLRADLDVGSVLLDVHRALGCANKVLSSFMHEKLYVRTEDATEGAFFNFLKVVYDKVLSFSSKVMQLWSSIDELNKRTKIGLLNSIAKDLVLAVCYLVEIEYDIVGNDLESLWLMIFSFATLDLSLSDATAAQHTLTSEIVHLGCQLVNLYSELRQVNNVIFSLCKMLRHLVLPDSFRELTGSKFMFSAPAFYGKYGKSYAESVSMVLCSKDFRTAIHNAIVAIPEGQVSGCIQQLKIDILESLEWIKVSCSLCAQNELAKWDPDRSKLCFDLQVELLGRGLSDIHALVLDSLTVTAGNSNLVRVSMKDLMAVLRLSMSNLVALHSNSVNEFLSEITGTAPSDSYKNDFPSTYWFLLFFFRQYMSCRSLCRQVLSLVPPDMARKMPAAMTDSVTAYSGKDWLEMTDWTCGGYFSWIVEPSASLFTVIQYVSDTYLKDNTADCSPLIYILNSMAIQRLVDLNRLIKCFEYLLQRNNNLVHTTLLEDAGASPYSKNSKKLRKFILRLKQEAADLTNFMMGHLPLLAKHQVSMFSLEDATNKNLDGQYLCKYDAWDFSVGSLNEKSLPSALWLIICQNIDVWCAHATKKKLKMFLSLLIQNSLLHEGSSCGDLAEQETSEPGHVKNVTTRQISLELLRHTVLYEQRFVRRHLASRFCQTLEKSVIAIFNNAGKVDLKSSPNWSEFLSIHDNSSVVVSGKKHVMDDHASVAEPISPSSKSVSIKHHKEQKSFLSPGVEFANCQTLLNFLCWIPKGCLNSKSLSLYATYIFNTERLVVGSLLDCHGTLYSHNLYELFRLFLSCRRALKSLIMGSCEEKMGASQCSLPVMFCQSSFPVLWLLKSLFSWIVPKRAFLGDISTEMKDVIFSLMDHTSYVFLILSKYHFIRAEKPYEEQRNGAVHDNSSFVDLDACLDSNEDIHMWETLGHMDEILKEQTNNILIFQREALSNGKVSVSLSVPELISLSSIISCSQGFLWGLASALDHIDYGSSNVKKKLSRWKHKSMGNLICSIDALAEYVNYFISMLVIKDGQLPGSFSDEQIHPISDGNDDLVSLKSSSLKGSGESVSRKRFRSKIVGHLDSIFAKCDSFELCSLKKSLLQGFLRGENPEAAFLLRQLFIASSALLRLNLQINCPSLSLSSVPILIGISQAVLVELANMVAVPSSFSLIWLDGIIKFLEELGNHFPLTNPELSRNVYIKLIELHLMAIGKCIALQGKKASLASHDTESSTKTLDGQMGLSESALSSWSYCLDEVKARLRKSFKVFIKKPLELHLLAAIQALEGALVGLRIGCTTNYEICTGSSNAGKVSSVVAAGIDCMDLVLEFVTGRKHLNVVKRHIQSLVACLFNIILHLQGPLVFYGNKISNKGNAYPDPGAVILMCIEVLTRVSGKHAIYQLSSFHVGQSLRIPSALFQNLFSIRISEGPSLPNSLRFLDNQDTEIVEGKDYCVVDRQFSIDLFAACCRLLSTVLKHHKSETEQCIVLLEDSISVLLHCLEMVDTATVVRKQYFAWEVQEAVKCAAFLRRIYEEMRQQKDVFARHCSLFLSNYIWTYSGYGPLRTGIRREVDEALRPGIYALIDACSADDLQHLHTVFGEGPCRSTLATLQHDYKLKFQYEGKV